LFIAVTITDKLCKKVWIEVYRGYAIQYKQGADFTDEQKLD
jgi:hypothetical protein